MQYDIHRVESIGSTNTALKAYAKDGAPHGYVFVADRQEAGRGRLGRSFYSPADSGLYVSILLRPAFSISPAALTCLAAVALCDTTESYGKKCGIKWVNDLYCNGKKAAGILTEGQIAPDGRFSYAIVGVGVNLSLPQNVPEELQGVLTGIFEEKTDTAFRDAFLDRFLCCFASYYDALPEITFWKSYRDHQICFGRRVVFTENGRQAVGTAVSIDRQFRLVVRTEQGETSLDRGEVSFL